MTDFELPFVQWLRSRQGKLQPGDIGIGDDMAMLNTPGGRWLISSDMLLDGVHFDTTHQPLSMIGRKAVACSLSDCAAMAVCPVALTVSMAWPRRGSLDDAKELYTGMQTMADEFETRIVGGDTTRWDHPLVIDVTIFAQPHENIEPVTRSGAKSGDRLYVTGPLGGSRLGRHLEFTPRVREARRLAQHFGERLHAMIDVSDGLALDLHRVCQASNVGATVMEDELLSVVSDDARKASEADGKSPMSHALGDGEDFELLIAVSGEIEQRPAPLYRIGQITDAGLLLQRADGNTEPLAPEGYVH